MTFVLGIDMQNNKPAETAEHTSRESNIIELENIQNKWIGFIENLSNVSGYEIVAAYLKMSKLVRLETDILILGLPEVILKTSQGIELERVTTLLNSFLGRKYNI